MVSPARDDDIEADLPPGISGEIVASMNSPEAFAGYWKRPDADAKAIQGGWYRTGDLGKLDDDGELYVVGRVDDMIISGGENIYPEEVEDTLAPQHAWSRGARSSACPTNASARRSSPSSSLRLPDSTPAQLDEVCLKGGLARFKRPSDYVFVKVHPALRLRQAAAPQVAQRRVRAVRRQRVHSRGIPMSKDYAEMRASVLKDLDGLHYEVDATKKVGRLWLDRPPLNIVSYRGRSQIAAIMECFGQDPDVRVVVIRGKNGIYTSGGDVKAFPADRAGRHVASRLEHRRAGTLPQAGDLRDGKIRDGRRPRAGHGLRHPASPPRRPCSRFRK